MTKDDILRMANEACGGKPPDGFGVMFDHDQLERFAALAEAHGAAAEREACASIEVHLTTPVRDYTDISPLDAYEAALMDAAMAFRESIRARGCKTAERGQG